MTYHWVVPLVAAFLNAFVGLIVLRHDSKNPLNRGFGLLSAAIVCWNLNIFVLYAFSDEATALYWSNVFRVGTLMGTGIAAHLMIMLSGTSSKIIWSLLGVSYAATLVLVGANATGDLIRNLRTYSWGFYPVGTTLYEVFPVLLLYNFVLSQVVLIRTARTSDSPRQRQQARLWIVGTAIAMPLGMTNMLATFGVPFYPLGNLASVVYAGFIAYSIIRYRLMDIDIVVTKGGAYTLVTLLVIAPAFGFVVWLQSRSFGRVDVDFSVAMLALFIVVAVLFPILRSRAEARLERSFFRKKHEYRAALSDFTRSIVRILDRSELAHRLAETLGSTLAVDRTSIALLDPARSVVSMVRTEGMPPAIDEFPADHSFVQVLERRQDPVLLDELEASRREGERQAAEICRQNGWEVCLPMMGGRKLLGFIGLGRKKNLDPFFAEELELLGTLAAEAGVALENAQLSEELRRSREIIRRADRLSALGTLAAGIAHEIRNPLVSIQTFFQLAPDRLHDQEFLTEFLRLTSGEVKRITDLISDLLAFARSPSPSMAEVDLNDLIEGVVRLVEPQVRSGQITIRKSLAADLPSTRADRDQLKQVFLNVLLNAMQAMEGGGEITIATTRVTHNGDSYCQVAIADSGAGIPPESLDDIFNPFFTTKDKGTGLGLAITNQVVAEHEGFISVDSAVGRGTTFRIHLRPAGPVSEEQQVDENVLRAAGIRRRHW
jgi:signal transduction histidine kinase